MAKNTATIIRFNYVDYAVESQASAIKVIEALGKLVPVGFHYAGHDVEGAHYFPKEGKGVEIEMKTNQPYRPKDKALRLPQPKRGQRRCPCGHSDVVPGDLCPSCGAAYPN